MSTNWVTDTGFNKKTLAAIQSELEVAFQGIFGDDIDLDATGPFGQVIGLLSKREADLWDGAEEIYTARNPQEATGTSLDYISSENGLIRLDATRTAVENVRLFGDEGTVVAAGSQAKNPDDAIVVYGLNNAVTITKAVARFISLEPDAPVGAGEDFQVTLDAVVYTYTTGGGDTKADVINGLITLIEAGSFAGTVSNDNDTYLQIENITTDFSGDWNSKLTLNLLASGGDFTADTEGPFTLPSNALTVIVTPVSGWDTVNNPDAGDTGRDVETDEEFRLRRSQAFLRGKGTDSAIKEGIIQEVPNVSAASVTSNRTLITDSEGRPPKSFEAVVQGGDDQDIADTIWDFQPAGISSYGNTTKTVTDSQGQPQSISFSRPTNKYLWVKVQRDFYDEEVYPENGDQAIKDAIVEWSLNTANVDVGIDIIRQRLATPIYSVEGIGDINILLDVTDTPGGVPTYAAQNIPISVREIADFSTVRIVVEDLP
jgi:uncharacterized phage protein gp47/JayE